MKIPMNRGSNLFVNDYTGPNTPSTTNSYDPATGSVITSSNTARTNSVSSSGAGAASSNASQGSSSSGVSAASSSSSSSGSESSVSSLQQAFTDLLENAIDKLGGAASGGTANATDATLDGYFNEASRVYGVEKQLLLAVAKTESNFTPTATSGSGAMGIMQLMPATAKSLNVANPYDPYENIMGGAKLLAMYMDKYNGDKAKTLAAYNAGGNRVDEFGGVPNEIWGYVNKVMGFYNSGVALSQSAGSVGVTSSAAPSGVSAQSVAANLKSEFSKFPEHQSYEMFLRELSSEMKDVKTPSNTEDAYRMLLGNARTAIQRVRSQIAGGAMGSASSTASTETSAGERSVSQSSDSDDEEYHIIGVDDDENYVAYIDDDDDDDDDEYEVGSVGSYGVSSIEDDDDDDEEDWDDEDDEDWDDEDDWDE